MVSLAQSSANQSDIVQGWRAIGQCLGRNPATLAHRHSMGSLPVEPLKSGRRVYMTGDMLARLDAALKQADLTGGLAMN